MPIIADDRANSALWEAMRYATLGRRQAVAGLPGDRIRVDAGCAPRRLPCAPGQRVECLHAYSLVHDDLPAMDDDDLRRGKPTTHKAFDEAIAILAGDGLQTLSFQILADPADPPRMALSGPNFAFALAICAAGGPGMVGGQMIDIAAETARRPGPFRPADDHDASGVEDRGADPDSRAESGGRSWHRTPTARKSLGRFMRQHLGLAFQIRDDLLDVEG